jgi:hypothetical protein
VASIYPEACITKFKNLPPWEIHKDLLMYEMENLVERDGLDKKALLEGLRHLLKSNISETNQLISKLL